MNEKIKLVPESTLGKKTRMYLNGKAPVADAMIEDFKRFERIREKIKPITDNKVILAIGWIIYFGLIIIGIYGIVAY